MVLMIILIRIIFFIFKVIYRFQKIYVIFYLRKIYAIDIYVYHALRYKIYMYLSQLMSQNRNY